MQYVNLLYRASKSGGRGAKERELSKDVAQAIEKNLIPFYRPRFVPPCYGDLVRQNADTRIEPEVMYLKPLTVIHPAYFSDLARCSRNRSHTKISWDGWTSTGSCEIHGISYEEKALGYQLRCQDCSKDKRENGGTDRHCHALTNPTFWEKWEHWEIPGTSSCQDLLA